MREIGLYVHIPFCKSKCLYCDFNSYEGCAGYEEAYADALVGEFEHYQSNYKFSYKTVFIGGGTPTFIHYELIGRLMKALKPYIKAGAEISMECNPGTVNAQSLQYYHSLGINRLSIGLQAWQNGLLKKIGRIHTVEEFIEEFGHARQAGFGNINVDLMFALPGQTLEMWQETLEKVCSLGVEHVSCYSLKLEEGTKLYDMYEKGRIVLPDEELDREMCYKAGEILKSHGLEQYEISNYSRPGMECRHNLIYWDNEEYLGIGAGSHSKLDNRRFWNVKALDAYIKAVESGKPPVEGSEAIDTGEDMWETIFLALRLNKGLDMDEFDSKYNTSFLGKYKDRIKKLIENNLVLIEGRAIKLTSKGRDLANSVFVEFMQ